MKGFCISLDVSKGSSFYQGFKGLDEPITKPKKIEHNLEGFKELLNLKEKIRKEYNEDCVVVFESTGIYHKPLQTYLDEHDFKYTIISHYYLQRYVRVILEVLKQMLRIVHL